MTRSTPGAQRTQLLEQRRKVDFDSYDVTVDELVRRVGRKRIEIAPAYQRQFRWDNDRQSRLIESLLLGIPVPSLFMATNVDADSGTSWEVVDGLQSLGWSARDAGTACDAVAHLVEEDPGVGVGVLMRAALNTLARR